MLPRSPELGWPADMYLEGSDQHRGWFQSSLLVALATRGRPPYREVLTHGFLIDLEGRKMSKSVGNAISPQEVIKESGAEIIRLWVAIERVHRGAARQQGDPRRASSTPTGSCATPAGFWWRISTTSTRRPTACPLERLDAIDRFALARYAEAAQADAARRTTRTTSPTVLADAEHLATVDLSAFYVDVTKDRMYTLARAVARAALDADRDVPDVRRPGAADCADPAGDRR